LTVQTFFWALFYDYSILQTQNYLFDKIFISLTIFACLLYSF
jgi:hypothetical protein